MDEREVRLRILESIHRHDVHPNDLVVSAKIFEDYILGRTSNLISAGDKTPKKSSTSPKQSGPEQRPG